MTHPAPQPPLVRPAFLGLAVLLAAYGSDTSEGSSSCVRAGDAAVCADGIVGSVEMSADGLKPGSTLRLGGPDEFGPPQTHTVGDDGELEGAAGFLGGDIAAPLVIEVTGTTADGDALKGEIEVAPRPLNG